MKYYRWSEWEIKNMTWDNYVLYMSSAFVANDDNEPTAPQMEVRDITELF